jgi:chromosome segregation ATPase
MSDTGDFRAELEAAEQEYDELFDQLRGLAERLKRLDDKLALLETGKSEKTGSPA